MVGHLRRRARAHEHAEVGEQAAAKSRASKEPHRRGESCGAFGPRMAPDALGMTHLVGRRRAREKIAHPEVLVDAPRLLLSEAFQHGHGVRRPDRGIGAAPGALEP